jgi:signal transduction histidine kinase
MFSPQRLSCLPAVAVVVMFVALETAVQGATSDTSESAKIADGAIQPAKDQKTRQSSATIHDRPSDQSGLVLNYITIESKRLTIPANGKITLPAHNNDVGFHFGPVPSGSNAPIRFRCQLDGFETDWHERTERMRFLIRFTDAKQEQISETVFAVQGESAGWTGDFGDSIFIQRKEKLTVPTGAVYYWMVITSAGPPVAIGAYALKNLVVSQSISNVQRLIPQTATEAGGRGSPPVGWYRSGMRLRDAWVVQSGPLQETTLAVVDHNPLGHTDWSSLRFDLRQRQIIPGDELTFEWEEAYSIGMSDYGVTVYPKVQAGMYRFRMIGLDVMGLPSGREISVPVQVPVAFWKASWFWMAAFLALFGLGAGVWRLSESRKMQRQVQELERQRDIEQERLRIARNIHDDLGARVTEIALLSSSAQLKPKLSEDEARAQFGAVSRLTNDLVRALYETVWAVNPKNDHLDSLASYVCQMAEQMCSQAQLRCRLEIPDLPADIAVASTVRHNVIMAVKEAIHNVIKHGRASEIQIRMQEAKGIFKIEVSDNGCGFDATSMVRGNGLDNMERRLQLLKGSCSVESRPGAGVKVTLAFQLPAS